MSVSNAFCLTAAFVPGSETEACRSFATLLVSCLENRPLDPCILLLRLCNNTLVRNPAHRVTGEKGWCPAGLCRTMICRSWTHSHILFSPEYNGYYCSWTDHGRICRSSNCMSGFLASPCICIGWGCNSVSTSTGCRRRVGCDTFCPELISSLSSLCMPRPQWPPQLFIQRKL